MNMKFQPLSQKQMSSIFGGVGALETCTGSGSKKLPDGSTLNYSADCLNIGNEAGHNSFSQAGQPGDSC